MFPDEQTYLEPVRYLRIEFSHALYALTEDRDCLRGWQRRLWNVNYVPRKPEPEDSNLTSIPGYSCRTRPSIVRFLDQFAICGCLAASIRQYRLSAVRIIDVVVGVGCEVKDAHNVYGPFVLTWKLVFNRRPTRRSWRAAALIPVIVAITPRTETPVASEKCQEQNGRQLNSHTTDIRRTPK